MIMFLWFWTVEATPGCNEVLIMPKIEKQIQITNNPTSLLMIT